MLDGELLQVAAPQDIYADPDERRVAEFIGSPKINMLDAIMRDRGLVDVAGTTLSIDVGGDAGSALRLGIRPEALHLAERPGAGTLTGAVRLVEHMGSDLYVHFDMAGVGEPLIARLPAERAPHIATGQTLHLGVATDRVLLFAADGKRIRPRANVTSIRGYVR